MRKPIQQSRVLDINLRNKKCLAGEPYDNMVARRSTEPHWVTNANSPWGGMVTDSAGTIISDTPFGPRKVADITYHSTGPSPGICCAYGGTGGIVSGILPNTTYVVYCFGRRLNDKPSFHNNTVYLREYNSGGAQVRESGGSFTYVPMGNGWYFMWRVTTTQATTAKMRLDNYQYDAAEGLSYRMQTFGYGMQKGSTPIFPYPFENRNASAAYDLSGKSNHATINNLEFTRRGSRAYFNGTSSHLVVAGNSGLASTKRSIEIVFKCDHTSPDWNVGGGDYIPLLILANGAENTASRIVLCIRNSNGNFYQIGWGTSDPYVATNFKDGKFHHIVWTHDTVNNKMTIIVDGILTTLMSDTEGNVAPSSSHNVYIGGGPGYAPTWTFSSTDYFTGWIDVTRMYDRIVTPDEALKSYSRIKGMLGVIDKQLPPASIIRYDMTNSDSFKGAPVTNIAGDIATGNGWSTRPNTTIYTDETLFDAVGVPPPPVKVGKIIHNVSGSLSSTWSGNSFGYITKDVTGQDGKMLVASCWLFVSIDCNITQHKIDIEQSNGEWTVPGYSHLYDLSKKGTWQRVARRGLADASIRFLTYPARTGTSIGDFTGFYLTAGYQIEEAASIPTEYIHKDMSTPFVRSATQALLDISGRNRIFTMIDMLYDNATKSFSFDGTGDPTPPPYGSHISFSNVLDSIANAALENNNSKTYSLWIVTSSLARRSLLHGSGSINHIEILHSTAFRTEGRITNGYSFGANGFQPFVAGVGFHLAIVHDNTDINNRTVKWYQNGILRYTKNGMVDASNPTSLGKATGSSSYSYAPSFLGKIPYFCAYQRAMDIMEVKTEAKMLAAIM